MFFFLSCRTPEVLQDTLVLDLLYSEAGQSLLNILGTGVDTIDKLVSLGRFEAFLDFFWLHIQCSSFLYVLIQKAVSKANM